MQAWLRQNSRRNPLGTGLSTLAIFRELINMPRVSQTGTEKIQKDSREIGLTRMGEVPRIREHLGV